MQKTHTIKAEWQQSHYAKREHLVITVDGKPLDHIVHEANPGANYLGLVPFFLSWLNKSDQPVVWERVDSWQSMLPVLMCPDDLDLWCTTIIADMQVFDDVVAWKRIGVDTTSSEDFTSEKRGTTVAWFENVPAMVFDKEEYYACIEAFRRELR